MFLKIITLLAIFSVSSLMGEGKILFALNNQYLSETMPKKKSENPIDGEMIGARYDIGDVIISTNLSRWKSGVLGVLRNRDDGYFIADIKNPTKKWTASIDVIYGFGYYCSEDSSYTIKLGANNGESIYISTNSCSVVVQDKEFKIRKNKSLKDVSLNYFIKTSGNNIIVMLNGQTLMKMPKGEFDSLKTIEMSLGIDKYNAKSLSYIKNITISKK